MSIFLFCFLRIYIYHQLIDSIDIGFITQIFTNVLFLFYILSLATLATASNIAVYWGQNAGSNQQSLGSYCSSTSADIVILSFLNGFPNLLLNFANQCSTSFSSGLLHCPNIGADIKSCQLQGKTVLLSLEEQLGIMGSQVILMLFLLLLIYGIDLVVELQTKDLLMMPLSMGLILILKTRIKLGMLL